MTLVKFDFLLHIIMSVLTGAVGAILWIVWYFRNRETIKHAWMIALGSVSLFPLLMAFEINDFPPGEYGLADAHSFWHLSTIPVSCLFVLFLFKESQRDSIKKRKKM
jgi:predicted permease